MNKDIQKCDPRLSDWEKQRGNKNSHPSVTVAGSVQIKRIQTRKTAVTGNDRPKRPSAAIAKIVKRCRSPILIIKVMLIPVMFCQILAVKAIVLMKLIANSTSSCS